MTFTSCLRMMFAWYQYMINGTYIYIWIHKTIDSGICEDFIKVCVSVIAKNKLQIKYMLSNENM